MNVHAQMCMLFHLDKCIGCHTCSVACKNLWTYREGTEYMWWNNVETRPGMGYPYGWEDQEHYHGGWVVKDGKLRLKLHNRLIGLAKLFYNPNLPELEDYYEPFTFCYQDLFTAPEGDDQPVAIPISKITGKPIDIENGPNWDDDLSGSEIYARNDLNMEALSPEFLARMNELEGIIMQYLPRICNHCLNPACVAACPSGAIYKRAEDGVVLVDQNRCRAWRMCISGCPYKKVYFNWHTGKSEKCILCFPRLETNQVPGCAHSCVGRIRYMGILFYDSDRIYETAAVVHDQDLVDAQREIILDPFDEEVLASARANGIEESWIDAAQRSPIYPFVKLWKIGLPLHPEFRTIPMTFYVPPLSPILGEACEGLYDLPSHAGARDPYDLLQNLDEARLPVRYLASLFCAGNEDVMRSALSKMLAVRIFMRNKEVFGMSDHAMDKIMQEADTNPEEIQEIYRLTAIPTFEERFVYAPYHREQSISAVKDPLAHKGDAGLGFLSPPRRHE
jgi:nitrate reductase beta subunit